MAQGQRPQIACGGRVILPEQVDRKCQNQTNQQAPPEHRPEIVFMVFGIAHCNLSGLKPFTRHDHLLLRASNNT